jgi:DNA-binding transcriptional MocR family regulator
MDGEREILYLSVADRLAGLIARGTYRPGDRLPSVRELRDRMGISANTAVAAYAELENRLLIEARPRSGHYVRPTVRNGAMRADFDAPVRDVPSLDETRLAIARALDRDDLAVPGAAVPDPRLLPAERLARMLADRVRHRPFEALAPAPKRGDPRLRARIAERAMGGAIALSPDDILITSGCSESLSLAVRSLCRPGDAVVIASPEYFSTAVWLRRMGNRVLEIPSDPERGPDLGVLDYVVRREAPAAIIVGPNHNNPLGFVMADDDKRMLVRRAATLGVPVIEDDVLGDLSFAPGRPATLKAFDQEGSVLLCSSFTKTLAPGFRVGWIAAGRFAERVERVKSLDGNAVATPTQGAIAEFLETGGYDRHLRALNREHARRIAEIKAIIQRHFPPGTRVTNPKGGFVLWVELPDGAGGQRAHEIGLGLGLGIAPGLLFSSGDEHAHAFRLNASFLSPGIARALGDLGRALSADTKAGQERVPAFG